MNFENLKKENENLLLPPNDLKAYNIESNIRWNNTTKILEYYDNISWKKLDEYSDDTSEITINHTPYKLKKLLNSYDYGTLTTINIVDNGDGTIGINQSLCSIKTQNNVDDNINIKIIPEKLSLSLTNNALNYIFIDGLNSEYLSTTNDILGTNYQINYIIIASIYRKDNELFINENQIFGGNNKGNGSQRRFQEENKLSHVKGSMISSTGLNIQITSGVYYFCLNRIETPSFDSSLTTFKYWKKSNIGIWEYTLANEIDNFNYSNSGVLTELTNNKFRKDIVYIDVKGGVNIFIGIEQFNTLSQAEGTNNYEIPVFFDENYAIFAGILIINKNETTINLIKSAFTNNLQLTSVTNHDNLSGLLNDTHTQYYNSSRLSTLLNDLPQSIGWSNLTGVEKTLLQIYNASGLYITHRLRVLNNSLKLQYGDDTTRIIEIGHLFMDIIKDLINIIDSNVVLKRSILTIDKESNIDDYEKIFILKNKNIEYFNVGFVESSTDKILKINNLNREILNFDVLTNSINIAPYNVITRRFLNYSQQNTNQNLFKLFNVMGGIEEDIYNIYYRTTQFTNAFGINFNGTNIIEYIKDYSDNKNTFIKFNEKIKLYDEIEYDYNVSGSTEKILFGLKNNGDKNFTISLKEDSIFLKNGVNNLIELANNQLKFFNRDSSQGTNGKPLSIINLASNWIASVIRENNNGDVIVSGILNSIPTIGSHTYLLDGWKDFSINPGGTTIINNILNPTTFEQRVSLNNWLDQSKIVREIKNKYILPITEPPTQGEDYNFTFLQELVKFQRNINQTNDLIYQWNINRANHEASYLDSNSYLSQIMQYLSNGTTSQFFYFGDSNPPVGVNGLVGLFAHTFNSNWPSTMKLKENIIEFNDFDLKKQYDDIMKIKFYNYDYILDKHKNCNEYKNKNWGFISENLEEINDSWIEYSRTEDPKEIELLNDDKYKVPDDIEIIKSIIPAIQFIDKSIKNTYYEEEEDLYFNSKFNNIYGSFHSINPCSSIIKHNIKKFSDSKYEIFFNKIKNVNLHTFDWNVPEYQQFLPKYGFISENLQQFLPDCVNKRKILSHERPYIESKSSHINLPNNENLNFYLFAAMKHIINLIENNKINKIENKKEEDDETFTIDKNNLCQTLESQETILNDVSDNIKILNDIVENQSIKIKNLENENEKLNNKINILINEFEKFITMKNQNNNNIKNILKKK